MSMKAKNDVELMKAIADVVVYDPDTGVFTWKFRDGSTAFWRAWNTRFGGKPAGSLNHHGYIRLRFSIDGKQRILAAHHLAWFLGTGKLIEGRIDHINQISTDNRLANLRDVSCSMNQRNMRLPKSNTSGEIGVRLDKKTGKWFGAFVAEGKRYGTRSFEKFDDAVKATRALRAQHGFTELHGQVRP